MTTVYLITVCLLLFSLDTVEAVSHILLSIIYVKKKGGGRIY